MQKSIAHKTAFLKCGNPGASQTSIYTTAGMKNPNNPPIRSQLIFLRNFAFRSIAETETTWMMVTPDDANTKKIAPS